MNSPLVSILIPFKNVASFFKDCLKAIQNQQYIHWEAIVVNDRSIDNSLAIAEKFKEQDKRFKVVNNTGEGIIEALRFAYSLSKGSLITRMDADDIMAPIRLITMVNSLQKSGKGFLAVGQVKYFAAKGINDGYKRYETWLNELTAKGNNFKEIYKECVIPSPCWMVHKSDLDKAEAFFPNRYPEDYDLAFRFYENNLKCIPCSKILHFWRDYQTRTSRTSEHYAQNYFLNLKLHYFLKLDHKPNKNLVIWGAGKKGKEIAKSLVEKKIPFTWVCDNPKKIGRNIYGIILLSYSIIKALEKPQIIITVANEEEQFIIRNFCKTLNLNPTKDYFFFC